MQKFGIVSLFLIVLLDRSLQLIIILMLTRFQFKLYVIFETLIIPVQTRKKIKFSCYTRWKFVDLFEFEA